MKYPPNTLLSNIIELVFLQFLLNVCLNMRKPTNISNTVFELDSRLSSSIYI